MLKYVKPGGQYTNTESGINCQVFDVGNHSETIENLVVYVGAEESQEIKHRLGLLLLKWASHLIQSKVWVEPLELFEQKFRE